MTEEYLPSQDLHKKFQEWFREPIPNDVDKSIKPPVSTDLPFLAWKYHSNYVTPSRRNETLQKIFELFIFGFQGAVFLGLVVGFIILLMYISYIGWSIHWPSPIVIIGLGMLVGFWGGLLRGSIYKIRERYTYEEKL